MEEHKVGEMDITEHEKTFDGFVKWITWSTIVTVVILILMAMWIS